MAFMLHDHLGLHLNETRRSVNKESHEVISANKAVSFGAVGEGDDPGRHDVAAEERQGCRYVSTY